MATTKAGPRSGIPSRFGYSAAGNVPAAKTPPSSAPNGGLVPNHTGKSQLAFNPSRKPATARSENNDMSHQQPARYNGLPEHFPIKGDVYIKLPNSTPSSRLSSPINTTGTSGLPPPKDKIAGGSKLQYSSPLNDIAKRREQSASPKTVSGDQDPSVDLPGHLGSLALADKKRHSSDSSANRYKVKQVIPSPLRESNKLESNHQSAVIKHRRGSSPHSALLKHDNLKSDSPIPAPGRVENRPLLKEPSEKHNRLSSGSSGSDDAVVPSHATAFHKLPRAESMKAPNNNQKITGIPRAFSPPPKTTEEVGHTKSKIKPQHHVLPMSSSLQMKPDNNATHSGQQVQRSFLPRSNPNQASMLPHGRATSPPHAKPNMLPRVIKMKNSNLRQPEDSHDSRKDDSPMSEHNKFLSAVNGDTHDKPNSHFRRGSLSSTTQIKPDNMAVYSRSMSTPNDIQPPPALVKTNLLEEANDTDSYISETGSESTAATVVLGKKSSIADLSSLDSSSPLSVSQSSKFPELSPPLNPDEFPAYFSHDTKVLGKLQNMGFNTGGDDRSATPKVSQRNTTTQEQPNSSLIYSEDDVTTALDDIVMQSDKTRVSASGATDSSHYNNHTGHPRARSVDAKTGVHSREADIIRDSSSKTMSLPNAARYDGLSRFTMKKDKPGKISEQRVSPERAVESGGHSGREFSYSKKGLQGGSLLSGKRERNKTIAFSKEFLRENKPGDDRGSMKPMSSGLKYSPSGLSEQNLASAGKMDISQLHSNLKLRAFSPPHTSFYSTSGLDAKREGKSSLDAARKKMLSKKPTESSNPDISKEKESVPIKPVRSDMKIMDYTSSPALKLKSPPCSVFKFPQSGSAASQPDEMTTRRQVRSPVRHSMIPSPVSPTSPINFNKTLSSKPTNSSYDSRLERSVSPPKLTQGLLRHHNVPNPQARKSFGVGDGAYMSTTDRHQGRAKSLSPVQTQDDMHYQAHARNTGPSSANTPGRTSSFRKMDFSAYNSSSKHPVLSKPISSRGSKNTDVLLSPVETAVNGETIKNEVTVSDGADSSVGGSTVESVGMLRSDLPHAMNDVQRVEIYELENNHKLANTLSADSSSNDHLLSQSDHQSTKQTTIPDHAPLSNAVIDKVANGVDSMGSHVDASPSVSTHSSMDRSHEGETVVKTTLEQEALLVSSSQSVNEPAATAAQQVDLTSDADILSDIIKQLSPESETVGQADAQSDDRSDASSQVSDRSRTSNFSFRLKPYMPAHVIAEESYLEQRKRESLSGTDRLTEQLANTEIQEVKRLTPEVQRRVVPTKKTELEKPSYRFQSDPNLDLRRSDSRSPPFLDRYTPENQFKDSELQELHKLISSYDKQVNQMKSEIDYKNKLLVSYERNMSEMNTKLQTLSANLEDKNAEIILLQEDKEKWPSHKKSSRKKASEDGSGVLSDGYLSDTGMDHSHSSSKKKKRPWRHISLRRKRNPAEPIVSPQVPHRHSEDNDQRTPSSNSNERGRLISQLLSLREDLNLLKTENSLLKSPGGTSTIRFSHSVQSLTNSIMPCPAEPLLVEVKPIQVHVDYSGGVKVSVTVQVGSSGNKAQDHVLLGVIRVSPDCNWPTMDQKIYAILEHHLCTVDPEEKLGLSTDSVLYYTMQNSMKRMPGSSAVPTSSPFYALGKNMTINVILKGASQGSCDVLAYHVLINAKTLQSYVGLLLETKCLVLMGTKGSCKSSIANYLGKHLVYRMGDQDEGRIVTFNVAIDGHEKVIDCLRSDVANSAEQTVLVLDDVSEYDNLERILSAAALLHQRPYIIAVFSSGLIKGNALHHLLFNHQVRVVTCSPDTEPIKNVLARSLRKNVLCLKNQSSSTDPLLDTIAAWLPTLLVHLDNFIAKFHFGSLSLGPRVFLNCPLNSSPHLIETWFINLWNHFIIPYLTATTLDGIKQYGVDGKVEWIDARDWVLDTYPWKNSSDMKNLNTVTREDVGFVQALRQQKQSSPLSAGSQQSLQDSCKPSYQSTEDLPVTNPLHGSKMESML